MAKRFRKIPMNMSKTINAHCVDHINTYWRIPVAHVGNDNNIHSEGKLVNGVPAIAIDSAYAHDDIAWVKWDGKNLIFTRE